EVSIPGAESLELPDPDARDAPGRRAAPDADDRGAPQRRGDSLAADLRAVPRPVPLGIRRPEGQTADPPGPDRGPWRPRCADAVPPRPVRRADHQLLRVLFRD